MTLYVRERGCCEVLSDNIGFGFGVVLIEKELIRPGFSLGDKVKNSIHNSIKSHFASYPKWRRDGIEREEQALRNNGIPSLDSGSNLGRYRLHLDRKLDQIERYLLETEWTEDIIADYLESNPSRTVHHLRGLGSNTLLAIVRACLRGDQEKAAELFEAFLGIWKSFHLRSFPTSIPWMTQTAYSRTPVWLIGGLEGIPEEALTRLGETLESALIPQAQLEHFRAVEIMDQFDQFTSELAEGSYGYSVNTWHELFGGVPERAVSSILKPAMRRSGERLAMAWIDGDEKAILEATRRFERVRKLMNIQLRPINGYYNRWNERGEREGEPLRLKSDALAKIGGAFFNREVILQRIMLGVVLYHRYHDRYPDRIDDLVPDYLPASYLNQPDQSWTFEAIETPMLPVAEPVRQALPPTLRNRFEAEDRLPVVYLIHHPGLDEETWRAHRNKAKARIPAHEDESSLPEPTHVSVTAYFPAFPIVEAQLIELLDEAYLP